MLARLCALVLLAVPLDAARAIMAGAPPDSADARADPNRSDSPWAGVGSLLVGKGVFSAVAIGPRHVLTAGHVAGDPTDVSFQLNLAGDAPHVIAAESVHRHPGFARYDPKRPRDDLAVIVLAEPLPPGTPVYPIHRSPATPHVTIVMVGYGASGNGDAGVTVSGSPSVKRVGRNQIDAVGVDEQGRQIVFLLDFDGGEARNLMGGETLGNEVESSFAGGDSGSPSFVCEAGNGERCAGGRWALVGINTFIAAPGDPPRKPSTFGTIGGGMLLSAYADWIDSVLSSSHAAQPPRAPGDKAMNGPVPVD
jgi:hypothetical protein